MKSVLLSHPHAKADAQGVALSLQRAGLLGAFFTGLAAKRDSLLGWGLTQISQFAPQAQNRVMSGLGGSRLYSLGPVELAARAAGKVLAWTRSPPSTAYDCLYLAHDAAVATLPWPSRTDGVYAYEDGALRTFQRAARKSIARLWDLPTPHYKYVESMLQRETARWPELASSFAGREPGRRQRRKDAELQYATHVVVASQFTADSLRAAGCRHPTQVVPYGFPVDSFQCKAQVPSGRFVVLAVGNHSLRKGTHYLLEAWKRAELRDARLRFIGRLSLPPTFLNRYAGTYEHVPYLPKNRLTAEYHAADVLVFPSLADGFGLVIQEAMCCGTPVIATPCSGGPECLRADSGGWIIPEANIDALIETLRKVARDRDATYKIGLAGRRRAESYTWHESGRALADFVSSVS